MGMRLVVVDGIILNLLLNDLENHNTMIQV